jgi:hypothetical protein
MRLAARTLPPHTPPTHHHNIIKYITKTSPQHHQYITNTHRHNITKHIANTWQYQ